MWKTGLLCLLCALACVQQSPAASLDQAHPVAAGQAQVSLEMRTLGVNTLLALRYDKPEGTRRFVGIALPEQTAPVSTKAWQVRLRAQLAPGQKAWPFCVLWGSRGLAWRLLLPKPLTAADTDWRQVRFSLPAFEAAAFSSQNEPQVKIADVHRVWVGLALEGSGAGAFQLADADFTSTSFVAEAPLDLPVAPLTRWNYNHDAAVQGKLSLEEEAPGKQAMRLDFTFPGGRHMYALPGLQVPKVEWEGYYALRLTYQARLPQGITSLLIMLQEAGGAQYVAHPAPPAAAGWHTVTLPFADFVLGGWSHDADNKLDLQQVVRIVTGVHGTSELNSGTGFIVVRKVELVPWTTPRGSL